MPGVSRTLAKAVRLETEAQHAATRQALRPTGQTTEIAARSYKEATEVLLPMQNQGSTAAKPSVLPASPDCEEEKGTLLLLA